MAEDRPPHETLQDLVDTIKNIHISAQERGKLLDKIVAYGAAVNIENYNILVQKSLTKILSRRSNFGVQKFVR